MGQQPHMRKCLVRFDLSSGNDKMRSVRIRKHIANDYWRSEATTHKEISRLILKKIGASYDRALR
jgi:hypothetical protein